MSSILRLCGLFIFVSTLSFGHHHRPKIESVTLHLAFVPIGFDSNDQIEFVVAGQFYNTCYQVYETETKVEGTKIWVEQKAKVYSGICLGVRVPYHKVVRLPSELDPNTYEITDRHSGIPLGKLKVERADSAGPGPDNFNYAPVSDAFIVKDGEGEAVVLRGNFTNNCWYFKDIKMLPYDDHIVVLPIVDKHKKEGCEDGLFSFEERRPLPEVELPYLLHVRSMNGQSINKVNTGLTN